MTKQVYISAEVADVRALHSFLGDPDFRAMSIREQLLRQARTLCAAHSAGDQRVAMQLSSWWPNVIGKSPAEILQAKFDLHAACLTIAREYGFPDWRHVEELSVAHLDPTFELAVDTMLAGDIDRLDVLLTRSPGMATQRSRYGHRSSLLHYLGANGVESHRQVVPENAVALAELLIGHGADPTGTANMYGGGQTAFDLAVTSVHPSRAGIADELAAVLQPH